jgi:hypothetical protein
MVCVFGSSQGFLSALIVGRLAGDTIGRVRTFNGPSTAVRCGCANVCFRDGKKLLFAGRFFAYVPDAVPGIGYTGRTDFGSKVGHADKS